MARTAVIAGTATAVQGRVEENQRARAAAAAPAPPTTVPAGEDLMAQLERLTELRTGGLLDDAEFAAAKARLLGLGA